VGAGEGLRVGLAVGAVVGTGVGFPGKKVGAEEGRTVGGRVMSLWMRDTGCTVTVLLEKNGTALLNAFDFKLAVKVPLAVLAVKELVTALYTAPALAKRKAGADTV